MNINASDEVDGCHQSKAVGLDTMIDCSMSQDMNSQPTNQPSDNSFKMEECYMEGIWITLPRLALK